MLFSILFSSIFPLLYILSYIISTLLHYLLTSFSLPSRKSLQAKTHKIDAKILWFSENQMWKGKNILQTISRWYFHPEIYLDWYLRSGKVQWNAIDIMSLLTWKLINEPLIACHTELQVNSGEFPNAYALFVCMHVSKTC